MRGCDGTPRRSALVSVGWSPQVTKRVGWQGTAACSLFGGGLGLAAPPSSPVLARPRQMLHRSVSKIKANLYPKLRSGLPSVWYDIISVQIMAI